MKDARGVDTAIDANHQVKRQVVLSAVLRQCPEDELRYGATIPLAEAEGIRKMNKALTGTGGEAIVKLRIAEALQGKRFLLLPTSEGGLNLKTTDINRLIETLGVKSLSGGQ